MCGCGFILIVCANKRLIQEASLKAKSSKATLRKMPALKLSFVFSSHTNCVAVCRQVCAEGVFLLYFYFFLLLTPYFCVPQIVALREQNAHIQRKVASGEGGEDILEGSEAQQKVHGKVSSLDLNMGGKNGQNYVWIYNNYTTL